MNVGRPWLGWCVPLTLMVGVVGGCERREPLNLILVTIDTLRADVVGCYGDPGGHTPALDTLASRGVVFENAVAPMATTFPSHASMLTGFYPRVHGVRWNGDALAPRWSTLAEILRDAGYVTAAFVSYKDMVHRGGLGQGFQTLSAPRAPGEPVDRPGTETNRLAVEWLEARDEQPFFLWVHYFEPHLPYEITDYSWSQLMGYKGPLQQGASLKALRLLKGRWASLPRERAVLRTLYAGNVREADERLGHLLDALEGSGLRDETIVAVLADHGEVLGEHGHTGHGLTLAEEALQIPFVIADPRHGGARRVRERVGAIDLMPTLLELLEMQAPRELQGRSLAPAIRGERLARTRYFSETRALKPHEADRRNEPDDWHDAVAVYEGDHKLVLRGERSELLRVAEGLPVAQAEGTQADQQLREQLEQLARSYRTPPAGASPAETPLSQETLEELKALGYVE